MKWRLNTALLGLIVGAAVLFIGGVGPVRAESQQPGKPAGITGKFRDPQNATRARSTSPADRKARAAKARAAGTMKTNTPAKAKGGATR